MKQDYYIYLATCDGDVPLYVGSGRGGRINHVNSGNSHSKLLNKHLLTIGKMVVTKLAENLSNEASLVLEQECIDRLSPPYNVAKKVVYRAAHSTSLPVRPENNISVAGPSASRGWATVAADIFSDPCSYYIMGDAESKANYEMRIVDRDKQLDLKYPPERYTELFGVREKFDWE